MPKGFYDLSERPKTLNKRLYLKILGAQKFLIEQNEHLGYLREFEPVQYEDLKEFAARLQMIISQYWGEEICT